MDTARSGPHRAAERFLDRLGVSYESEVIFNPYCVDIHLTEFNLAIEVDGPQHGKKREAKRDQHLMDTYQLKTLRIKGWKKEHEQTIIRFIEQNAI